MQFLEAAGADFLPSTIDSYTRQNRYAEAERGIEESRRRNRSMLNGFPAVNYGVEMCRRVADSVNVPLQARHGTPDSRLLAEIIHAAGWTSNEGGGISYNLPYAKNVSIADSLWYWQYCDRLVGYYEDHGVSLNREPFGPLTGTLVPLPFPILSVSLKLYWLRNRVLRISRLVMGCAGMSFKMLQPSIPFNHKPKLICTNTAIVM